MKSSVEDYHDDIGEDIHGTHVNNIILEIILYLRVYFILHNKKQLW